MLKFLGTLLIVVLFFAVNFWWLVGLIVGMHCYYRLGLQSRFLGWPLVLITEVLVWQTDLWRYGIPLVFSINLAILALFSFYFQMKDEEADPRPSETEAFSVRMVFPKTGPLESWSRLSVSIYSIFAGWGCITLALYPGTWVQAMAFCLSAMSAILITVRFSGGMKGKLWETMRDAFKVQGGLLPRPTFD